MPMEKMTSGVGGDLKAAFIFASDYLKTVCKGAAVAVTKRCAVSGGRCARQPTGVRPDDGVLRERLKALAQERRRFGFHSNWLILLTRSQARLSPTS
jgi:hypothetical protein